MTNKDWADTKGSNMSPILEKKGGMRDWVIGPFWAKTETRS